MADEYEMRRDEVDGPLGEDGPIGGGEVTDRGLFGPHRRDYYDEPDAYASELGGGGYGRRPGGPYEEGYGGYGAGGGGYYGPSGPPMGYEGGGYGGVYGPPPPGVGSGASDLGQGLVDAGVRTTPDYGSSLTRPDFAGVPEAGYEVERGGRHHHGRHGDYGGYDEEEEQRRHKHYAEAAAAAALGYGLHERHERRDAEERLEELGYGDGRREHHRF